MNRLNPQIRAPFVIPAESYDRLMGRYLPSLAPVFADAAEVHRGQTALDVGSGPGGLTRELVARLGATHVAAIDPSPTFVEACAERHPDVDVRQAFAEDLPFPDASFDVTLASLVVGFMSDPVAGAGEMKRVTKSGGIVATCFWDRDRMPSLSTFWKAAASVRPGPETDMRRLGTVEGELATLLRDTGLVDVRSSAIPASAEYADFEDWWQPFTFGVGPAGAYYESLTPAERNRVRDAALALLGNPAGGFTLAGHAWCATGRVA